MGINIIETILKWKEVKLMKKKLMLLFLTISILMMVLVGCSNNSNNIQKNSTNKEKIME